jgi:hypothetical protein
MLSGMATALRWLPLVSALFQLIGTALIVWGLRIRESRTIEEGRTWFPSGAKEYPLALIEHHWPRLFTCGKWLLLAGLTLAVVSAVRAIS